MVKPVIRNARPSDAPALKTCIDAAYAGYAADISDLPDVSGGIGDDIRDNLVLVADVNGRVVGGAVLIENDRHMLLANIAVHPEAAGLGVGRTLLNSAESEALKRGLIEMRLSTHVDMPDNVALYQHLGWNVTGRSGNKIFMVKELTADTA